MRAVVILGAMVLAVTSVQDAEARGRRGGGSRGSSVGVGVGVGVGYSSSTRSEESSSRRAAAAGTAPVSQDPAFLRPILPVRAPVQEAAPTRSASAGCASGRLIGQGAGFCQLN